MNISDPVTSDKQTDDRWGHSFENDNRTRGNPALKDEATEKEYFSRGQGRVGNLAHISTTEFRGVESSVGREETQLIPHGPQLQTWDTDVHAIKIMQEASGHQLATTVIEPMVSENSYVQQHQGQGGDYIAITDGCNALNEVNVSGYTMLPVFVPGQRFSQIADSVGSQPSSSFSRADQSQPNLFFKPSNGLNLNLNGTVQDILSHLNSQNQTQIRHDAAVKTPEMLDFELSTLTSEARQNVATSEQIAHIANLSASLTRRFGNDQQFSQPHAALDSLNSTSMVASLPNSARLFPSLDTMDQQPNPDTRPREHYDPINDGREPSKPSNNNQPPGFSSTSYEQKSRMPLEHISQLFSVDPDSNKLHQSGSSAEVYHGSPKLKQQEPVASSEVDTNNELVAKNYRQETENILSENVDADGRVDEGNNKDEKEMRLFKTALVEFVKEILKPTWKEGKMSREVHKTVVKKVVDKVTSTVQGEHVPKTQDKITQYLSFSKPKITKLVQAYVERLLKN